MSIWKVRISGQFKYIICSVRIKHLDCEWRADEIIYIPEYMGYSLLESWVCMDLPSSLPINNITRIRCCINTYLIQPFPKQVTQFQKDGRFSLHWGLSIWIRNILKMLALLIHGDGRYLPDSLSYIPSDYYFLTHFNLFRFSLYFI